MIKKIKNTIKNLLPKEKNTECAIDGLTAEYEDLEAPAVECDPGHFTQGYGWLGKTKGYTGTIPAPKVLIDDPWFGHAPMSTKQLLYVKEQLYQEEMRHKCMSFEHKEPENTHQVMYEMATKSGATTIQLDPIGGSENFQGGSENVHR
tara:strand:+ start:909 stop:1352 length:444 start_codon:yes stop_codon:yes gene_type:complete